MSSRVLRSGCLVTYDGNARVTRLTDPDGKADTLKYDASGRLSSVTDRRGGVTSYTYDATSWFLTKVTLPQVPIDAGTGGLATPPLNQGGALPTA